MEGIALDTGVLTAEQIDLVLRNLPADITFIDEHDEVRYYSAGPRIFTRSPVVIGHKVQSCHPPASLDKVQEILDAFRAGRRDSAEFWHESGKRFIYIRYVAVRDAKRVYRGCLELVQDVAPVRESAAAAHLPEGDDG